MSRKVYVGMSGGVDSSVAAALLVDRGYDVTGVYMKNWSQDLPGLICPWQEDYQDAKRVAVQLGIAFKLYDFESEYRHKVVDYMVSEYQAGRTPNPDIMCNQEVKFKLFLNTALEDGADLIATGHYARIQMLDSGLGNCSGGAQPKIQHPKSNILLSGLDQNKDQSYFLYRVTEEALSRSLMPIGESQKPAVRALAKKLGLATADKRDSQGICFVGKVGIKDFLLSELGPQPQGAIIDQHNQLIGEHDGALFYTIGQRHGLQVGGGLPYYVVGKDMTRNEVRVTTNLDDTVLWRRELRLSDLHWINETPDPKSQPQTYYVRTRYRAPLVGVDSLDLTNKQLSLKLCQDIRAITPGQSAVLYDGDRVLGGGIVV